jgi:P27 family predicted phage terminase small subunit
MGRPSKPVEQKRAAGNPGKRALPAAPLPNEGLTASEGIPVPPADLTEDGLACWNHTWESCRTWLSPESDRTIITLFCHVYGEHEEIRKRLLSGEYERVYTHSNGAVVTSPWVTQLKELRVQLSSWIAAIGLSPSDRSRLGLSEVRVRDEMDELERRRLGRASGT